MIINVIWWSFVMASGVAANIVIVVVFVFLTGIAFCTLLLLHAFYLVRSDYGHININIGNKNQRHCSVN